MLLEVKNLVKQFNKKKVLNDISFGVEPGIILGLLGPNGAGKSTTINIICTILKPDSGEVLFDGKSIVNYPQNIRQYLGFVPQDIALYQNLSVKDNLYFWGKLYGLKGEVLKTRMSEVLDFMELKEKIKEKVENLSGGMKRKVNIAAAIMHKPKLLIMDEPTVGIDVQARSNILSSIKKLNEQGTTMIFTSHYIDEVEFLCDQIAILNEGQIKGMGNIQELRKQFKAKEKLIIKFEKNETRVEKLIQEIKNIFPQEIQEMNGDTLCIQSDSIEIGRNMHRITNEFEKNNVKIIEISIIKVDLEDIFLGITNKKSG